MTKIPFYDFKPENALIEPRYNDMVGLQLLDGNFLTTELWNGVYKNVVKIDRITGESTILYSHPTDIWFNPLEVLNDGNVILMASTYPHKNHRLFRSTDATLSNFVEVLNTGYMKPYSKHSVAQGKDGTILYGEYVGSYAWNEDDVNTECKIWRSRDNGMTWEVANSFVRRGSQPQGSIDYIQHIHLVEYDPYTDLFWVGSGDKDNESGLWTTKDGSELNLIGRGYIEDVGVDDGQLYRAIGLEFYSDCILWGTDGFKDGTWIIRYDRKTGELIRTTPTRTASTMFYSGTLHLQGGNKVSFFSDDGLKGSRIYYTYDQENVHELKAFEEVNRIQYTENPNERTMVFTGDNELKLDGNVFGSGTITFLPRDITLNFLGS